jgi:hypothetical protein
MDLLDTRHGCVDVITALGLLGGKGKPKEIYAKVHDMRVARGDPLGQYDAWIRNALQENSRGKGHNLFVHIDRGVWGLKSMLDTPKS